jgi:hypothetical protein
MRNRKAWELRGKLVAFKGRVGMITRLCRDGTLCITFVDDGLEPRVAYRVRPKDVL